MIEQATHSYKHKGLPTPTLYKVKSVANRLTPTFTHVWFWDNYTNKWIKSYSYPPINQMKELVCSSTP